MKPQLPLWNPRRRRFLQAATAAAAAPSVACSGRKSPWRFFSVAEAVVAEAMVERLIPADEFPGAAWAGAVVYIDRQLDGHFRKQRDIYRAGLRDLDRASQARFQKGFAAAETGQQVELLELVEKGKAGVEGWADAAQRRFFSLVLAHTMQSYYGDPRHGGNKDQVGYRMLGIPATPVRGREQHDLGRLQGAPGGKL
jgi:gluconate 2-dehydrogenase gamma chain